MLVVERDQRQLVVLGQVRGHRFEVGHDTVGLEFLEQRAQLANGPDSRGETGEVVHEGFDDRDLVFLGGDVQPFDFQHVEVR